SERNAFLRNRPSIEERTKGLLKYDRPIAAIQSNLTDILATRAGNTIRRRAVSQNIAALRDEDSSSPSTDIHQMLDCSESFYSRLYATDHVDITQLDDYFASLVDLPVLDASGQASLVEPITIEEILSATKAEISKKSSPEMVCSVFNDALLRGVYPASWQDIRVRLLPKKSDLTLLKNWRPISLINCDAKIFTRIINYRMRGLIDMLINKHQTGFMPGRFIAENGLLLSTIMDHARKEKRTDIALLLDQEKAYDRVHPAYLRKALQRFRFPEPFIHSIIGLFFGNQVRINVNGYFSHPITQQRGLRQGDPLSPILFNLALEPFLRHILQDTTYRGFTFPPLPSVAVVAPAPIKVLAYADDICVFLSDGHDFARLQVHLQAYGRVSNARANIDKTEAISLNGDALPEWQALLRSHSIYSWHDRSSDTSLRYLGFPVISHIRQRRWKPINLWQSGTCQLSNTVKTVAYTSCGIFPSVLLPPAQVYR
ncbi:Transposon TX1 uncharacterized protein, partial [Choanephora cucurbitarum]